MRRASVGGGGGTGTAGGDDDGGHHDGETESGQWVYYYRPEWYRPLLIGASAVRAQS
jgi:hypothetical protein